MHLGPVSNGVFEIPQLLDKAEHEILDILKDYNDMHDLLDSPDCHNEVVEIIESFLVSVREKILVNAYNKFEAQDKWLACNNNKNTKQG